MSYFGRTPNELLGSSPQYFYALRRNDDGELFLVRSDQLIDKDAYYINIEGPPEDNFEDFEAGVDFFDAIDDNHELIYKNLRYPQYRWDNRAGFYFVDANGNFVQRLFSGYDYPTGVSSDDN
jgi:cytochrome oxidase Cu insertion factor (SCO1/SenC/PrrC family)